jgi:hypothetical protein
MEQFRVSAGSPHLAPPAGVAQRRRSRRRRCPLRGLCTPFGQSLRKSHLFPACCKSATANITYRHQKEPHRLWQCLASEQPKRQYPVMPPSGVCRGSHAEAAVAPMRFAVVSQFRARCKRIEASGNMDQTAIVVLRTMRENTLEGLRRQGRRCNADAVTCMRRASPCEVSEQCVSRYNAIDIWLGRRNPSFARPSTLIMRCR